MMNLIKVNYDVILPILILLLGGIGWLYKHEREKRVLIQKQLWDKKYEVYFAFISVYFDLYKTIKKGQKTNIDKLIPKMIDIKKELVIYGSDKVLKKFFEWENASSSGNGSLRPITDVIIEMRKDMGNPKTTITTTDFLKSLVRDQDEYESLKNQGVL